ncbi:Integrase core domain-containing protein [Mesorhizobium albiziae]|uniref:Integrase core domain-containing protein n=1 Tax=Neomesorhizobium albiziae TaxID=335020 RepID=A0A1I4F3U7_9HYPH|nr:transposase [Mesorhizobium albiziae]SFL12604.1 Integrase core domain-containing protein [Mesorhizobium albiziae]
MPGKPINDQQMRLYMRERQLYTQKIAAARAGFSERTARRIEADPRPPSQCKPVRGRTVPDPLGDVWKDELEPMLERNAAIRAVTLLRYLQQQYPDRFADSIRRTIERRVRDWRARRGPDKVVIFRQAPVPGQMALSDFTDAGSLGISIAGTPFAHRLYHFVLAYSGWEHAGVVLGGESFTALAEHLQNALWTLGGVPAEHRTDSLSAAFKNLSREQADDITRRYLELCGHYRIKPSPNNPGEAHENGTVEAHHGHLKDALDQALMLRGSRDFASFDSYRHFLDQLVGRRNLRRRDAVRTELASLRPLPQRRTTDFVEIVAPVTRTGGFQACGVFYSAPSRLIGHRLRVHIYDDRIEAFLGNTHVVTHQRARGRGDGRRVHVVDYRHVIHALKRKPMALAGSVYRDGLFPRDEYRRAWIALSEALPRKQACKRMVGLLALAHEEACEAELAGLIAAEVRARRLPDPVELRHRIAGRKRDLPVDVPVVLTPLATYDSLLEARS